jgi:Protein of unknown function (DUF3253)
MSDAFENAILRLISKIGPGESISPAEAAREASQETGVEWEQLLKAIRRAAVKLATDGRAVILLKGEAVDPENFRGIYRIGGGDYFTPRKAPPAYKPPPPPLAPARDYKPAPRPYTPPPAPAAPAPASRAIAPAAPPSPARLTVRLSQPAPVVTPPPAAKPALPPVPPVVLLPSRPVAEPVAQPRLEPQHLFENEPEEVPVVAEAAWAADEGTPVTRFEFDPRGLEDELLEDEKRDEAEQDFLSEAQDENGAEDDVPSPLPPLAPSLSFDDDDDYEDEDAHRAPRSATLDDIASQLERYLAAEFNNPARGNAEIGDDVVRLPRQQDE